MNIYEYIHMNTYEDIHVYTGQIMYSSDAFFGIHDDLISLSVSLSLSLSLHVYIYIEE